MARRPGSDCRVKLLLDEHFSPEIARQLRAQGHDVIAIKEHPELIGRPDRVHFASMPDQRRAIVTQDLGDFRPLLAEAMRSGTKTYGLVCVPARVSLSRKATGQVVEALDRLLRRHPRDEDLIDRGGEIWLPDKPSPSASGSGTTRALRMSAGSWKGRSVTGAEYVESRRGDLNERLRRLGLQ